MRRSGHACFHFSSLLNRPAGSLLRASSYRQLGRAAPGVLKMDKKFPSMPALPNLNTSTTRVDDFDGPEPSAMSKLVPRSTKLLDYFLEHMSFYRIHLGAFVLIPLVTSGVFYACNGRYPVTYVDSLFVCYSAMTVTGLSTINLSTITVWQQVILFLLMLIVSPRFVQKWFCHLR